MSDTIAERPMTAFFLHRLRAASPLLWWTSMAFLICFALCLVLQTVDKRLLNGISVYEFQLELGRRLAKRIKDRQED